MHLWHVAIQPNVLLKAEYQELVCQHCRKVFTDVDVQHRVEVLVFVILQLTKDGDLGGGGGGMVEDGRRNGEGGGGRVGGGGQGKVGQGRR